MAAAAQVEAGGLSPRSLVVYRHLIHGEATCMADLRALMNLSPAEALADVESLARRGLLGPLPMGERDDITVPNPILAINAALDADSEVLRTRQREADELRRDLMGVREEVMVLRDRSRLATVEVLDDQASVVGRLGELFAQATRDVAIFLNNKPSAEALEAARPRDRELLARGVAVRVICLGAHVTDRTNREYLRWFAAEGAQVRVAPHLPTRLLIQDSSVAVVSSHPTEPAEGAIIVTGAGMLAALTALFERHWEIASPIEAMRPNTPRMAGAELTASHREAISLMARGMKDAAIARQMAVSVRTVRRLTAEISQAMDHPPSRFALGVEAVRRGWLSH